MSSHQRLHNLQNRNNLLLVECTTDEWMDVQLGTANYLQAEKGDTLRLVLYTTDFEITIRDNTDYHLTIDLTQSSITIPSPKRSQPHMNKSEHRHQLIRALVAKNRFIHRQVTISVKTTSKSHRPLSHAISKP